MLPRGNARLDNEPLRRLSRRGSESSGARTQVLSSSNLRLTVRSAMLKFLPHRDRLLAAKVFEPRDNFLEVMVNPIPYGTPLVAVSVTHEQLSLSVLPITLAQSEENPLIANRRL